MFSIHLYLNLYIISVRSEDGPVGTGQALRRSLLLLLRSLCDRQRRKALAPGTWWLVPELRSLLQEGKKTTEEKHVERCGAFCLEALKNDKNSENCLGRSFAPDPLLHIFSFSFGASAHANACSPTSTGTLDNAGDNTNAGTQLTALELLIFYHPIILSNHPVDCFVSFLSLRSS